MLQLILFNVVLIVLSIIGAFLCRKYLKTEKAQKTALFLAAFATFLCHYSPIVYHLIKDGTAYDYLEANPNLLIPIYPCNVVMCCSLIQPFLKFKSKIFDCFTDYIFLFGIISTLVGMFANVDFIRNPDLGNYDVLTGVLSHAILFFNVILIPAFGLYKLNFKKNLLHIFFSIIAMFLLGCYSNLMFRIIGSADYAWQVNSMFILHSPFDGMPYLTYPLIALIALIVYAAILFTLEKIFRKNRKTEGK